jgi:hypothetical protein
MDPIKRVADAIGGGSSEPVRLGVPASPNPGDIRHRMIPGDAEAEARSRAPLPPPPDIADLRVTLPGPHSEDSMEGEVGPGRHPLPTDRPGRVVKMKFGGIKMYMYTGEYDDGRLGEIFIKDAGKQGSTLQGLLESFAIMFSIALQYGAEFDMIARKFHQMNFEPNGLYYESTQIRLVRSPIDAIIKELTIIYGSDELKREILNA